MSRYAMEGDTSGTMRKLHEEHSWYKTDSDKTEFSSVVYHYTATSITQTLYRVRLKC